jgi:tetratricopeptide (TPR) repeat protein
MLRSLVPIPGLLALLLSPASARVAPDYAAAKRHFLAGKAEFAQRNYVRAAEEFQAAFEITKDPVVLFNIGESYEKAGLSEEAVRAYEGYLAGVPSAPDRDTVESKITALKRGAGPSAPPADTKRPPADGPSADVAAPHRSSEGEADDGSRLRTAGWIGIGLVAALATTAGMLALSAQSREDDIVRFQHSVDARTGAPLDFNAGDNARQYQNLFDDGHTYKDLSIAFFALAGAAAVATTTVFIIDHYRSRGGESERGARALPVSVGGAIAPGAGQVALRWSF